MSHSAANAKSTTVVVVVGLPVQLRSMLEAAFKTRVTVKAIPMKQVGGYALEAPPQFAANLINTFATSASSYESVAVVVLPYVRIPSEVAGALEGLRAHNSRVRYPSPGTPPWPPRPKAMDGGFFQKLIAALKAEISDLCPPEQSADPVLPSIAFADATAREPRLIVPESALIDADRIWEQRFLFVNRSAIALIDFAKDPRPSQGPSVFFKTHKVKYVAHDPGASFEVKYTIRRAGKLLIKGSNNCHLKDGDFTAREDAVRIYFMAAEGYVFVFHCGPHPTTAFISVDINLP